MKKRIALLPLSLILLLVLALPVAAQGPTTEPNPITPPPLPPIWNETELKIEYQRVDVTIEDQLATTRIDQLFVNENEWMAEGSYLFPLPPEATVSELTMWVDGQPIEARILSAGEAREIYDDIVRQMRDPALLEYVGSGAIQANVFPIPPNGERRIEIEYTHLLPTDNGLIHYAYPQATTLYTNLPLEQQSIRVQVNSSEAIRAIYSPSHAVAIERDGEFRATVGYEDNAVTPDQDFELYYSVSPEAIGLNLLTYKEAGEDGYFMMLLAPAVSVDTEEIVARDVIIVLDTSGSMEGQKLAQAKNAAHYVVEHLNPEDRFNIISFSTGVRSYAPQLVPASEAGDVASFIDNLQALGGTNISLALLDAMQQADAERPLTVLFLTDGLATEGIVETPRLLDAVAQAAPPSARLFAFGVGHDVDTLLLDSLTEAHRGTTTYVRPGQAIDEAVSAFYARVSTPVLADVQVEVEGVMVEQLYPTELPDLFAGSQLVLAGRYREGSLSGGAATITVTGQVNGRPQTFVYEGNHFRQSGGEAFIPRLWATRAIGHLLKEIRLHGENEELVQSVVNLSLRYGIITPYTSFLIEEDDIFSQSGRQVIMEEAMEVAAAPAVVSGADAVAGAAAEAEMEAAEAPLAIPSATPGGDEAAGDASGAAMRAVGSKTFVLRDGVWIDTTFDAETHEPQQVGFAGEAYFELLGVAPQLGQYLALGPRVIVVHEGLAYETVEGPGDSAVMLPAAQSTPARDETRESPTDAAPPRSDERAQRAALPCASALILPLLAALFTTRSRRSAACAQSQNRPRRKR
ncbi:MAG TPA: VIT domain-containing protein [Candidatus Sulfomarinibacteraceae bacterium]|nr:VIT domain-containing protein [Candidatus Sulfomarinibacteraceae bacterium]